MKGSDKMKKIFENYKNMKSLKKICTENKISYANFSTDRVSEEKVLKVEKGVKEEIIKMLVGGLYG